MAPGPGAGEAFPELALLGPGIQRGHRRLGRRLRIRPRFAGGEGMETGRRDLRLAAAAARDRDGVTPGLRRAGEGDEFA
jgi:hypothetical protein